MSRSDTLDPEFSPGTYVIDTDSGDPDLALVLSTPGATCIEWDVDRDSPDGRTVADDNPDYSDSESVVVVAFVVTGLERRWEDWTDADPSDLFHGAVNASVKFYSFPESRLERATDYYGSSRRKPRALARE
jgi:hypothetical protein